MKQLLTKLKGVAVAALAMGLVLGTQAEPVSYLEPVYVDGVVTNGIAYWTTNSVDTYDIVASSSSRVTWGAADTESWYVVTGGTFQIDGGVACAGHVRLVLCDGAKLTVANCANYKAGIATDENGSFAIYEQPPPDDSESSRQVGELTASGGYEAAGIGGNNECKGKNITINGGVIFSYGGKYAAGIGGANDDPGSSDIAINGGTVTAIGGYQGAGLGGGYYGSASGITVNGGTVTATGGNQGAGLGGGYRGAASGITVNGGTVTATGGSSASGIGAGKYGQAVDIKVAAALLVKASASNPPQSIIEHTDDDDLASALAEKQYATVAPDTPFSPDDCITFSSDGEFTLAATEKSWDGTLWWSTNKTNWTVWEGTSISAGLAGESYQLHVRGNTDNTKFAPMDQHFTTPGDGRWVLTSVGENKIACSGNIETLRGASGNEPSPTPMANFCYANMFYQCESLTTPPSLPATTLSEGCYAYMFTYCRALTEAPALPATNLAAACYEAMFAHCRSLTEAPALPATNLASQCYQAMFQYCHSLTEAPELPALHAPDTCYGDMFKQTPLKRAPSLPATTVGIRSYYRMFAGCTNLTEAPALPATSLEPRCYECMFADCHSLTGLPVLAALSLDRTCCKEMFKNCYNLAVNEQGPGEPWSIPGTAQIASNATYDNGKNYYWAADMFANTDGDVNAGAEIVTGKTYYVSAARPPTVSFTPAIIDQTTSEVVYLNGFEVADFGGVYTILSNGVACIVYTDGAEAITNAIDTSVNPATVVPGTKYYPWQIGATAEDDVEAWMDGTGTLVIEGTGKMADFGGNGAGVPWNASAISAVTITSTVTQIGAGAWYGLGADVVYSGQLSSSAAQTMARGFGSAAVTPEVRVVSAQQRYPWNGMVDITYATTNVTAAALAKGVDVTLRVAAVNVADADCLDGDTAVTDGEHTLVWDMGAQGIDFRSTNAVFEVSCETEAE